MTNTYETQHPQGFYQLAIIINLDCVIYLEDKMGVECLCVIAFAAHTACNGGQAEGGKELLSFIDSLVGGMLVRTLSSRLEPAYMSCCL